MCIADLSIGLLDNSIKENEALQNQTNSFYTHVLHQPTFNPTSACDQIELCQTPRCSSLNCCTQSSRAAYCSEHRSCHECSGLLARGAALPLQLLLLLQVIMLQQQKLSSVDTALQCNELRCNRCIAGGANNWTRIALQSAKDTFALYCTAVTSERRASADITGVQRPIALKCWSIFEVQCGNTTAVTAAHCSRVASPQVTLVPLPRASPPISLLSSSSTTTRTAH